MKERPANATHWSVRTMAAAMGISHTSVQRIWREHGLKPHLVRGFKVSNDPDFVAKVKDVVGLDLPPQSPQRASALPYRRRHKLRYALPWSVPPCLRLGSARPSNPRSWHDKGRATGFTGGT